MPAKKRVSKGPLPPLSKIQIESQVYRKTLLDKWNSVPIKHIDHSAIKDLPSVTAVIEQMYKLLVAPDKKFVLLEVSYDTRNADHLKNIKYSDYLTLLPVSYSYPHNNDIQNLPEVIVDTMIQRLVRCVATSGIRVTAVYASLAKQILDSEQFDILLDITTDIYKYSTAVILPYLISETTWVLYIVDRETNSITYLNPCNDIDPDEKHMKNISNFMLHLNMSFAISDLWESSDKQILTPARSKHLNNNNSGVCILMYALAYITNITSKESDNIFTCFESTELCSCRMLIARCILAYRHTGHQV